MDAGVDSENDSQESDSDMDSDTESVCSTVSNESTEPTFKVFVKQFPPSVKKQDIENHLSACHLSDNVRKVRIFYGKDKKSKGCGYIEFTPQGAGQRAIGILNGSRLLGVHKIEAKEFHDRRKGKSKCRAKRPSNRGGKPPVLSTASSPSPEGELYRVFVGAQNTSKLPESIHSAHIRGHFREFQPHIQQAFIVTDPQTKQSKGIGFVVFNAKQAAESAVMRLNGSSLRGCQLKVEFAKPKGAKTSGNDRGKSQGDSSQSSDSVRSPKRKDPAKRSSYSMDSSDTMPSPGRNVSSPLSQAPHCVGPASSTVGYKVFINGTGKATLPESVQPNHLRNHFAEFKDEIVDAYIAGIKQQKRYGFVIFSSFEIAEKAVQARNGTKLHGCQIKVQLAKNIAKSACNLESIPVLATKPLPPQPQHPIQPLFEASNTICMSNLNPEIDSESIRTLCGGTVTDLKVVNVDSKSNNVIITFSSVVDAKEAINQFDGKDFLGQTVSAVYFQPDQQPQDPPVQLYAPSAGYIYPVKVTHLATTVNEAVLQGIFKAAGEIVGCKVFATSSPYALVSFKHGFEAEKAVNIFDGKVIDGMKVNVSKKSPQSRKGASPSTLLTESQCPPVTVQVSNLNPHSQVHEHWKCLTEVFSSYRSARVEDVCPPHAYIKFDNVSEAYSATEVLHQSIIGGSTVQVTIKQDHQMPSIPDVEHHMTDTHKVIQLTSVQWNLLTAFDSAGSSLYQEVVQPFKTNPNVKVELLLDEVAVHFTGKQDAVESAHRHFNINLQRHVPVEQDFAQAIMELYPDLPRSMSDKYGVTLTGFQENTVLLKIDGSQSGVPGARTEIDSLFACFQISVVRTQQVFSSNLLMSAKKRLRNENIVACLFHASLNCPDVTICSFSDDNQEKAVKIVTSKPSVRYVPFQPNPSLNEIPFDEVATEFSVSIDTNEVEQKIYIRGFVRQDVISAQEEIQGLICKGSVQFSPIVCSPEQILYLSCKLKCPNETTQQVLHALPAEVVTEPNRDPHFKGSLVDIESSQKQLVEGPLLCGLKHQSFTFKAQHKFYLQIEQHVLKPMKLEHPDFEYVKSGPEGEPSIRKGSRGSTKAEESEFTITVFSQNSEVFQGAVSALKNVTRCVKTLSVTHSKALECVNEKMEVYEQQYRVQIVVTKDSGKVLIFGLTMEEASQCLYELREQVDSTVDIEKCLKLDRNQAKYLQTKKSEEWKDLQLMCKSFKVLNHRRQEMDTVLIRVEGTIQQVRAVQQGLDAMRAMDYFAKAFTVVIAKKHNKMWWKYWNAIKKEKEQSHDFIIEVSRKHGMEGGEECSTFEYEFVICGGDKEGSGEVELQLSEVVTKQNILNLSEKAIKELDKGRKDRELHITDQYIVDMFIDFRASRVVLTAPIQCSDDLEAAAEEIERYIGHHTLMEKEIVVDDAVIGLILQSKSKSSPHLVLANQLAKPYSVSIQCLRRPRCGLCLRGSQDSIIRVEPLIRQKIIAEIQSTVSEITFPVDPTLIPFFETPEFVHFLAKIKDDLCIDGTFPKTRKHNKVIKSVYLKTTTSASCIKLDICKGELTNEDAHVDAIVNAANEDLHHLGGVARTIVEAGGDIIQQESNLHIQIYGKLQTGSVVCLGAGNLLCKKVLHAVGPRWVDGSKGEEQALYFTVLSCLQECQKEGLESVALPAISTGIFAVPHDVCIRASMKAIRDFCQITPNSCVSNVRFVLLQDKLAKEFALALSSDVLLDCTLPAPQHVSTPAMSHSYTWEWMDDHGTFIAYPPNVNSMLNEQYTRFPDGSLLFSANKGSYVVEFSTMLQTNVISNFQRKVRRIPTASAPSITDQSLIQWKFLNDEGRWTPYVPSDSKTIESMFQNRAPGQINVQGRVYGFDFNEMCQINVKTSYKRSIKRSIRTVTDSETQALPKESLKMKAEITLRGPTANLPLAKSKLDSKLKGALKSGNITFPISLERKIIGIVQQHKLTFSIRMAEQTDRKAAKKCITFQGLSHAVNRATSAMQEEIINYHTTAAEESVVEVPPEWQSQTQNLEMCPVASGSLEWNRVESKLKNTLPNVTVVEVTRIQNKWLWERYAQHKQRLAYKNDGSVNEKELFHGTRNNDPKLIYEGEDGFDMRYSAQGMWGLANYFAVNANYSHRYAYTRSDGAREMFLVKVLTGDSYQCSSNPNLRMPPEKQGTTGSGRLQFAMVRYDTVNGTTGGSQVFMTYDNDKAYPAYLIQYY